MEIGWLPDQLKTMRNLCDISLILIEREKQELLPTVLELLYQEAQAILDSYCVERKNAIQ